jgi:CHASE3 domain sensor protein
MTEGQSMKQSVLKLAQRGTMRLLATQLLSAAVVLLFSAVLLFGLNIVALRHQIVNDRTADLTVEQLYETENHLLNIELAVRGYALTGDTVFPKYFQSEQKKLAAAFKPLPSLTAGMPDHERRLKRVVEAVQARTAVLANMMRMALGNPARVGIAILDPRVRNTMRAARSEIGSMRSMELTHREDLASASEQKAARNNILAGGILIVSVLLGAAGLFFAFFGGHDASPRAGRPYPG